MPSDSIIGKGTIKSSFVITIDSIQKRKEVNIGSVEIKIRGDVFLKALAEIEIKHVL